LRPERRQKLRASTVQSTGPFVSLQHTEGEALDVPQADQRYAILMKRNSWLYREPPLYAVYRCQ